jgi:hypothetical protein
MLSRGAFAESRRCNVMLIKHKKDERMDANYVIFVSGYHLMLEYEMGIIVE